MESEKEEFINVTSISLEDWLALVFNPPPDKVFLKVAFPSDKLKQEYIDSIDKRSEEDINRLLLRFLVRSGSLRLTDSLNLHALLVTQDSAPEMYDRMMSLQYYRRLVCSVTGDGSVQPWEGITWVLDLLPHFPKEALEVLDAYVLAHAQLLSDQRLNGLWDAAEILRAKYIGLPGTQEEAIQFLLNLQPRQFECLIERLYDSMGYDTELTPPRKDGGRDVKASKEQPGRLERLLVESKRHSGTIGVGVVRQLNGVVSDEKANKGVVVTTSRFSVEARKFAMRNPLELIDGQNVVLLLNEHLGPRWAQRIDRLVAESERKTASTHSDTSAR
ncbi:MAG TPA: restriction endonuclease [Pyrinomonadaceae bacterium]